jgi:hypothetical protein
VPDAEASRTNPQSLRAVPPGRLRARRVGGLGKKAQLYQWLGFAIATPGHSGPPTAARRAPNPHYFASTSRMYSAPPRAFICPTIQA